MRGSRPRSSGDLGPLGGGDLTGELQQRDPSRGSTVDTDAFEPATLHLLVDAAACHATGEQPSELVELGGGPAAAVGDHGGGQQATCPGRRAKIHERAGAPQFGLCVA